MKKIKKENLMLSRNHTWNSGSLSCENVCASDVTPFSIQGIQFSKRAAFSYAFCKTSIKINKYPYSLLNGPTVSKCQ